MSYCFLLLLRDQVTALLVSTKKFKSRGSLSTFMQTHTNGGKKRTEKSAGYDIKESFICVCIHSGVMAPEG